jgi:hypothetical protein
MMATLLIYGANHHQKFLPKIPEERRSHQKFVTAKNANTVPKMGVDLHLVARPHFPGPRTVQSPASLYFAEVPGDCSSSVFNKGPLIFLINHLPRLSFLEN